MPDAIFAHPRLAAVSDAFDGHRDDLDPYLALAEEVAADVVLDVGCGTGSLAVLLVAGGRTVVAVDPAETSLSIAKVKDRAAKVRWIHGDATALPPLNADLALMTGNVAQVFLTDDEWEHTLRGIGTALRPGGYLAFETRRPEYRAWRDGGRGQPPGRHEPPEAPAARAHLWQPAGSGAVTGVQRLRLRHPGAPPPTLWQRPQDPARTPDPG